MTSKHLDAENSGSDSPGDSPLPDTSVTSKSGAEHDTSRRPFVPQVVEVIDDEDTQTGTPPPSHRESQQVDSLPTVDKRMKLPIDSRAVINPQTVTEQPKIKKEESQIPEQIKERETTAPEKSNEKVVVDELFQSNTSMGYPEISEHKGNPLRGLIIWAIIVIAIAGAIGAIIVFFSQGSVTLSTVSITPVTPQDTPPPVSTTPETAISPTAAPVSLDKEDLEVQVLNGGGVKGAAGEMRVLLEEAGYTVSNVGNADDYTYETTEVYVKADKEDYLQLLKADIEKSYTVSKAEATLEDDVAYDARVIVGKE